MDSATSKKPNFKTYLISSKGYNSKGLALFLSGYCNLFHLSKNNNLKYGSKKDILKKINYLANLLISLKSNGYSGACWGYNFDWQSRRLFLFKSNTPTVVATAFCVEALFKSYEITKNQKYKKIALTSAEFVLNDLKRTTYRSGFLFSYSVTNGNNTVFNASLLGVKILVLCYKYSKKEKYKKIAQKVVSSVCDAQNDDGSWVYGLLKTQSWIDSFHTGYNLDALYMYQCLTNDNSYSEMRIDKFDIN